MSQRVLIIVNPISGRRPPGKRLDLLCRELKSQGFDALVRQTQCPGDAGIIAAGAGDDVRAVLVHGGDGTVREAAEGLVASQVPIYHLPIGNENLFAKHFGMSLKPDAVAEALKARRTRLVDMLTVNGSACTSCLGVGFDAQVVRRVAAKRRGHVSNLTYVWPIAATTFTYRFPELEVEADGKRVFAGAGMLFAGNLTRYGGGIPLFRKAVDDDGLVDVVIFPCATRMRLIRDFVITLAGRHYNHKNVIYLRAASLKISTAASVATQVDGDVGPAAPIEVSVRPRAMNVLLP